VAKDETDGAAAPVGENLLLSNFSLYPEMNHLRIIKRGKLLSRNNENFLSCRYRCCSAQIPFFDQKLPHPTLEQDFDGGRQK
jgi:hypothetical protein